MNQHVYKSNVNTTQFSNVRNIEMTFKTLKNIEKTFKQTLHSERFIVKQLEREVIH